MGQQWKSMAWTKGVGEYGNSNSSMHPISMMLTHSVAHQVYPPERFLTWVNFVFFKIYVSKTCALHNYFPLHTDLPKLSS